MDYPSHNYINTYWTNVPCVTVGWRECRHELVLISMTSYGNLRLMFFKWVFISRYNANRSRNDFLLNERKWEICQRMAVRLNRICSQWDLLQRQKHCLLAFQMSRTDYLNFSIKITSLLNAKKCLVKSSAYGLVKYIFFNFPKGRI